MRIPARAALVVAIVGAMSCSDSGSSTAPIVASEGTFDVRLNLDLISVVGDCEDTPGDPGEFVYRIRLEAPRQSHRFATPDYPEETGAVSYSEGTSYPIGVELALSAVPSGDLDSVVVRFSAVEFDSGAPDPRMSFVEVLEPLRSRAPQHTIDVRLGADAACQLVLAALPTWTFVGV